MRSQTVLLTPLPFVLVVAVARRITSAHAARGPGHRGAAVPARGRLGGRRAARGRAPGRDRAGARPLLRLRAAQQRSLAPLRPRVEGPLPARSEEHTSAL